jgi:hypothetical protein
VKYVCSLYASSNQCDTQIYDDKGNTGKSLTLINSASSRQDVRGSGVMLTFHIRGTSFSFTLRLLHPTTHWTVDSVSPSVGPMWSGRDETFHAGNLSPSVRSPNR